MGGKNSGNRLPKPKKEAGTKSIVKVFRLNPLDDSEKEALDTIAALEKQNKSLRQVVPLALKAYLGLPDELKNQTSDSVQLREMRQLLKVILDTLESGSFSSKKTKGRIQQAVEQLTSVPRDIADAFQRYADSGLSAEDE